MGISLAEELEECRRRKSHPARLDGVQNGDRRGLRRPRLENAGKLYLGRLTNFTDALLFAHCGVLGASYRKQRRACPFWQTPLLPN